MERLEFGDELEYNALESAIHLTRYTLAKDLCKDKVVLDIACGEGYGSYLMSTWGAKQIEAVDISQETINKASKQFAATNINYICHEAERLHYQDATFDLIVSLETMEHLEDPNSFFNEIKRVLKPNGTLILSCPNDNYFIKMGGASENPYHKKKYSFEEFSGLAESYFGGNCDYYLGYATGGFINLPISRCNRNSQFNTRNPYQMFRYKAEQNYFEIPTHYNLDTENCSYYVGIWGKDSSVSANSVFYAKDQCNQQYGIELMNKSHQYEEIKEQYKEIKEQYKELKEQYKELQKLFNELEFTCTLQRTEIENNKGSSKQYDELQNIINELESAYSLQKSKIEDTWKEEVDKKNIEIDRLKVGLLLSEKEKNIIQENMYINWELANKHSAEIERIYSSKTLRYMGIVYKCKDKMRRIFKRL